MNCKNIQYIQHNIHQCYWQTDRWTDGRHAIAIPCFALQCIAR